MNKLLLAGIALVAVASGSAMAADLPVRQAPPAYAPPPVVVLLQLDRMLYRSQRRLWLEQGRTASMRRDPFSLNVPSAGTLGGAAGLAAAGRLQLSGWRPGVRYRNRLSRAAGMSKSVGPTPFCHPGVRHFFRQRQGEVVRHARGRRWLRGIASCSTSRAVVPANNSFEFTGIVPRLYSFRSTQQLDQERLDGRYRW